MTKHENQVQEYTWISGMDKNVVNTVRTKNTTKSYRPVTHRFSIFFILAFNSDVISFSNSSSLEDSCPVRGLFSLCCCSAVPRRITSMSSSELKHTTLTGYTAPFILLQQKHTNQLVYRILSYQVYNPDFSHLIIYTFTWRVPYRLKG